MLRGRGRIQFIKIAIGAIIVLAVFYFLFSNPNAHSRAKQAISSKFTASAPRERPILVKGTIQMKRPTFRTLFDFR